MKTFYYLATPYSKYPHGLDAAFRLAVEARGLLLRCGVAIWLPAERPILDCASGLIMLMAESWLVSFGMHQEREVFEAARKPIIYMKPGEVPPELVR